jgi:hypothetical protein
MDMSCTGLFADYNANWSSQAAETKIFNELPITMAANYVIFFYP